MSFFVTSIVRFINGKKGVHDTVLYNKGTNFNIPEKIAGSNIVSECKVYKLNTGIPLLLDGLNGILTRLE